VSRISASQHRNWPPELHLQFERRLALARVATWEAEVTEGRQLLTPQLLAAIAWDRALAEHIDRELAEQEAPT
jgi:hypothetical protein